MKLLCVSGTGLKFLGIFSARLNQTRMYYCTFCMVLLVLAWLGSSDSLPSCYICTSSSYDPGYCDETNIRPSTIMVATCRYCKMEVEVRGVEKTVRRSCMRDCTPSPSVYCCQEDFCNGLPDFTFNPPVSNEISCYICTTSRYEVGLGWCDVDAVNPSRVMITTGCRYCKMEVKNEGTMQIAMRSCGPSCTPSPSVYCCQDNLCNGVPDFTFNPPPSTVLECYICTTSPYDPPGWCDVDAINPSRVMTTTGCRYCLMEVETEGDRQIARRYCGPRCTPSSTTYCCQENLCNGVPDYPFTQQGGSTNLQ